MYYVLCMYLIHCLLNLRSKCCYLSQVERQIIVGVGAVLLQLLLSLSLIAYLPIP